MRFPPLLVAIAIVPKIPSLLSLTCSSSIVYKVLSDTNRRKMTCHRLVAGLSFADCFSSFAMFIGTWAIPKDSFAYWAIGTQETCDAQGFLIMFGVIGALLYNATLGVYYVLQIRYNWPSRKIVVFEKIAHFVVWVFAVGIASAEIPLQLYNSIFWICYPKESPSGCLDTARYGYTTCDRGDNAWIYQATLNYTPALVSFVSQVVSLILCYHTVRKFEKKNEKYGLTMSRQRRDKSRAIFRQALLYVCAFFATWIFGGIGEGIEMKTGEFPKPIVFLITILNPLQGFWNWLIYNKSSYEEYRKRHPNVSRFFVCCFLLGCTQDQRQEEPASGLFTTGSSRTLRKFGSLMSFKKRKSTIAPRETHFCGQPVENSKECKEPEAADVLDENKSLTLAQELAKSNKNKESEDSEDSKETEDHNASPDEPVARQGVGALEQITSL